MQNGINLIDVFEEPGRKSHVPDYFVLTLIIAIGAYLYFYVALTDIMRFQVIASMALGYLLWGLLHHWRNETLTWGIMLEYHALSIVIISLFIPILLT